MLTLSYFRIFLDDPSSLNSKAIVCRTSVELQIESNESNVIVAGLQSTDDSHSLQEAEEELEAVSTSSVNLELTSTEILMVPNMAHWEPYHLLHPTCITLAVTTKEGRAPVMDSQDVLGIFHDAGGNGADATEKAGASTSISLAITEMRVRVSLSDLLLVQNILLRRTLIEYPDTEVESAAYYQDFDSGDRVATVPAQAVDLSHYRITSSLQQMSFVLTNDFDRDDILPLVRCTVDKFSLGASGEPYNPTGTGLIGRTKMLLQLESHNYRVSTWEPVIEPWEPCVQFMKKAASLEMNLVTRHTVQLTLTSDFLETFSKTYASLITNINTSAEEELGPMGITTPAAAASALSLTLINKLGVPVDIYTSGSESEDGGKLWCLTDSYPTCCILPSESKERSNYGSSSGSMHSKVLSFFDRVNVRVHFDQEKNDAPPSNQPRKAPLLDLPTFRTMSKVYRLWDDQSSSLPAKQAQGGKEDQGEMQSAVSREVAVDDELFEYQRYVIGFGRSWKGKNIRFLQWIFPP